MSIHLPHVSKVEEVLFNFPLIPSVFRIKLKGDTFLYAILVGEQLPYR